MEESPPSPVKLKKVQPAYTWGVNSTGEGGEPEAPSQTLLKHRVADGLGQGRKGIDREFLSKVVGDYDKLKTWANDTLDTYDKVLDDYEEYEKYSEGLYREYEKLFNLYKRSLEPVLLETHIDQLADKLREGVTIKIEGKRRTSS